MSQAGGRVPYEVVPITEQHVEGFRAALDSVARECVRSGHAQFVALAQEVVVGWCDVLPKPRPTLRHSGVLGIGVVKSHRGRGIGAALIGTALEAARSRGLTRVELTVRTDNPSAKALYEKFAFVVEGLCQRHMCVRGVYHDSYLMAVLYPGAG